MGQKCPCYRNKSTEENTIFFETQGTKAYRNKKYEDLINYKSKNVNSTNYNDENFETVQFCEEKYIDKIRTIQTFARISYFKIKMKPLLIENTKKLYEEKRGKFTSTNLQKAENNIQAFQILAKEKRVDASFHLHVKILFSKNEKNFYSGQFNIKTEKHGQGFLLYENGSKYEGLWNEDNLVFGRYIDPEGNLFVGDFINFKLNKQGILHKLSNYTYNGNFVDYEKSGIGKEENTDYIYEGEFKSNKKHGNGRQIYKILGDFFSGEFCNDNINGHGLYCFKNGEKYNGTFEEGLMNGFGTYTWPDGSEYSGEYAKNLKHGNGIFKMASGKVFDGPFAFGKPHGNGKLTNSKGITGNVEFINGKLQKKFK